MVVCWVSIRIIIGIGGIRVVFLPDIERGRYDEFRWRVGIVIRGSRIVSGICGNVLVFDDTRAGVAKIVLVKALFRAVIFEGYVNFRSALAAGGCGLRPDGVVRFESGCIRGTGCQRVIEFCPGDEKASEEGSAAHAKHHSPFQHLHEGCIAHRSADALDSMTLERRAALVAFFSKH